MNNFERAVFVDYILNQIDDLEKNKCEISKAVFLKFGYHDNYQVALPENDMVSYDLAPNIDDWGATARKIIKSKIIPDIINGVYSNKDNALFYFPLSESDGYPYGIRESSIKSMINSPSHVFKIDFFGSNKDGNDVSKTKKERLSLVMYDKMGLPITLSHMIAKTSLVQSGKPKPKI